MSGPRRAPPPGDKKRRSNPPAPDAAAALWALEPHVCRHCFGRLVSRDLGDGHRLYQCTNCAAEGAGSAPDALCSCGLKIAPRGLNKPPQDAGLRCQPNPAPTPDFPSVFVAGEPPT